MTTEKVEFKTERLLLRPFRLEDVDDVFEFAKDPKWGLYMPVAEPYTHRTAEEFIARTVLASWRKNPVFARYVA